jgi:hypothetical protein
VSYPRRRARQNEEKIQTISKKIREETSDEAVATKDFDCVDEESYTDARSLWLDHAHGARKRQPGGNEGLVRQGAQLDVPTERSHAGRWRVHAVCVLG